MGKDIKVVDGGGKKGGGRGRKRKAVNKAKSPSVPGRRGPGRPPRNEPNQIVNIKTELQEEEETGNVIIPQNDFVIDMEVEEDPEVEAQITFGSRRRSQRQVKFAEVVEVTPPDPLLEDQDQEEEAEEEENEKEKEEEDSDDESKKKKRKRRKVMESPPPESEPPSPADEVEVEAEVDDDVEPSPAFSPIMSPVHLPTLVKVEVEDEDDPNRELTEEERKLQEMRIEEEINRLTDIREIVLDDNGGYIRELDTLDDIDAANAEAKRRENAGNSDDDYDSFDEADLQIGGPDETRCPPPAPPKRAGRKAKARDSQDEEAIRQRMILQQEMCTLIKNSLNTDSLSNAHHSRGILMVAQSQPQQLLALEGGSSGAVVVGDSQQQAVALINNPNAFDSHVIYQNLQRALTMQENWLQKKMNAYAACPEGFAEDLVNYNAMRNSLAYQLYIEHLCWISIKAVETMPSPFKRERVIAWLPPFKSRFQRRYPQLAEDARPNAATDLDTMLKIAFERTVMQIEKIQNTLLDVHAAVLQMVKVVKIASEEKRRIHVAFEDMHDELATRSLKFDEMSACGLRNIRNALEPPYFKTDDGVMAAPMFPDAVIRSINYPMCYFQRDKQKWTTKDLHQLKDCIKEVLQVKRFNVIRDRYEVLMVDCISQYEKEMEKEGRLDAPPLEPLRRKRGRPKKSELELTSKYGVIHPVIAMLPGGIVVRTEVTPKSLSDWRTSEEKKVRGKTYEELIYMENERVDWIAVSNKMVLKSRKNRSPNDCELAWRHEVHPKVFNKRWTADESYALKRIYDQLTVDGKEGLDWSLIANTLNEQSALTALRHGAGRTAYQCFFRIRNRLEPPKKLEWNDELDQLVLEKMNEHPGNWRLITASINNPIATKRQVIERYKKTINPMLRNGAFTRVEDCLLILTVERLKPFLAREGHFGCLLAYLPWRCETTWRDRANNLFSDWIVPWTIEEDRQLLVYARTMNRNWQKISEQFVSFKNRKGCLTRYKILKKRLKEPKFNGSLEAYHEAYAMTRYNIFQYKHLKVILKLLLRIQKVTLPEEHQTFVGLIRDQSPSETRLQHMLLTYDRDILASAIASLARYVQTRDRYWANWIETHGEKRKTFDRRTFHPENPQSVASALHIRGLELKRKSEIENISDFENEIYKFFGRFSRTKEVDKQAERRYIPEAKTLTEWSAVSRLIKPPPPEILNKREKGAKNKWETLNSDFPFENGIPLRPSRGRIIQRGTGRGGGRGRGRAASAQALVKTSKKRLNKIMKQRSPKAVGQKRAYVRRKFPIQKRAAVKKQVSDIIKSCCSTTGGTDEDEEGYLLIPPALKKPRKKRNGLGGKRKVVQKKMKKEDPEFKVEVETASEVGGTRKNLRRSCTKKAVVDQDHVYGFSDEELD